jgi:hypothetical protein
MLPIRRKSGCPMSSDEISRLLIILESLGAEMRMVVDVQRRQTSELETIANRLSLLERTQVVPLFYSLRDACRRLGISESTGYKHPKRLPRPVDESRPLRYRVEDVEELARNQCGRRTNHLQKQDQCALDSTPLWKLANGRATNV